MSPLSELLHQDRLQKAQIILNVPQVRQSVDELICLMFPQRGCTGSRTLAETEQHLIELKKRFEGYITALGPLNPDVASRSIEIAHSYFEMIPEIIRQLDLDAQAAFNGDPAAYSLDEVIITYPGFYALCIYRLANALHKLLVPLVPRLMGEYAHEKTGIDINPGAQIGEGIFIDHGTGVVIGETSVIGKNVKIYQGVTLGALSVKKKLQHIKRHPTIEDDVVIYANAIILGGETIIGKGSIIGGNVWLTDSVAPNSVVFNKLADTTVVQGRP